MSAITSIDKWLLDNRQWRREHNIAHAHYQLEVCEQHAQGVAFWTLVLERLEG